MASTTRAVHLADIADCARDVDFAIRWGFGCSKGPFELWQAGRLEAGGQWVKADIDAGKALRPAPLPDWVFDGRDGVHAPKARGAREAYIRAPGAARCTSASTSPRTSGLPAPRRCRAGTEVFENDEVRVWTLDGEVVIASITAKLHLISPTVTEGLDKAALETSPKPATKGLVIWSPDDRSRPAPTSRR